MIEVIDVGVDSVILKCVFVIFESNTKLTLSIYTSLNQCKAVIMI